MFDAWYRLLLHKCREMIFRNSKPPKENREMRAPHLPTMCPPDVHMRGVNMMCAFGVPANMIQGAFSCGLSLNPVEAAVA